MDGCGINRRDALKIGGGALGAVGAAAFGIREARADPWTWSPQGSVVGRGTGADPLTVWDPEADPVIADILEHRDMAKINAALRGWTRNGQPLPGGLPANLRDFLEYARTPPDWADRRKTRDSFEFTKKQGDLIAVLYAFASGMMATVIPHEARAVYYSKGGSPVYFKDRIAKTAKLGYDIGTVNAYEPDGEMIVTCIKTRMTHAAVRHLLPQSPRWPGGHVPITQDDLMITWHSLPTTIMQKLTAWRVPITPRDSAGYLHGWQLCGHFLGIRDEYIPATWAEADRQAKRVLDPALGPTPEGVALGRQLLELGAGLDFTLLSKPVLGAFTRFILGDRLAEWIEVPREPLWTPLLEVAWAPFVAVREGVLGAIPPIDNAYWLFDEFLRQFVLWYMSELRMPINIEIPTVNRKFG